MPIGRLSAAEAFDNLKTNPNNRWPRADDPDNRFATFADPAFSPGFRLEPGQRIFTIGSCFARNIEQALAARGFDIPMLEFTIDRAEWGGDPFAVLNNYVPAAIAPQIRWAFGLEDFDLDRHAAEVRPGRYVDLQLSSGFRPMAAAQVLNRRRRISAIYRKLEDSQVVLITLGLIEAWFDHRVDGYVNAAPPKSVAAGEPGRFELHILEYTEVIAHLRDLIALLNQVCPAGYRMILTVSPVPLEATFTKGDVGVANTYSKAVLRAVAEALVAQYAHIEYFPSYESVMLTDRSRAFIDDQIHVTPQLVNFNVERMVRRYLKPAGPETPAEIIARARDAGRSEHPLATLKILQVAWAERPEDPDLTLALARTHLRHGNGLVAERMLLALVARGPDVRANMTLAGYYNDQGRYTEAAEQAELAGEARASHLVNGLHRIIAYYHLGRLEEGLALLERVRYALDRKPQVTYWKARYSERLGRLTEAEDLYRQCNGDAEQVDYMIAFAQFLAAQGRWGEVGPWLDRILVLDPNHGAAMTLRRTLKPHLPTAARDNAPAPRADPFAWVASKLRRR